MHEQDPLPAPATRHLPDDGEGSSYILSVLSEILKLRSTSQGEAQGVIQVSIDMCCEALMYGTRADALAHFDTLLARGLPIAALVETVFPHCALRLGQLWADDVMSFADVSIGTSMLHVALRHVHGRYVQDAPVGTGSRVLLFALEGETHLFAPLLMSAMLERAGHRVTQKSGVTREQCLQIAATVPHDVVGISIGKPEEPAQLAEVLIGVRAFSNAPIMVGGPGLPREIPTVLLPLVDFWNSDPTNVLEFVKNCGASPCSDARTQNAAFRDG
ncbi:MAG: hypothetical protein AAFU59_05480 [Pseudomonadota bacterium]